MGSENGQNNSVSMKMLLAQQLQNKQLQSQLQQLQAVQQKVVEHQAAVMKALNTVTSQTTPQPQVVFPQQPSQTNSSFIPSSVLNQDSKQDLTSVLKSQVLR